MRPVDLAEFREKNVLRCEESFYPLATRSFTDIAAALAEETGEVARIAYRVRNGKLTEDEARANLAGELADVLTYVDIFAARAGIDLSEALREKFNVVSGRVGSLVLL